MSKFPKLMVLTAGAALLWSAGAAFAASDYLLQIENSKGSATGAPAAIEVQAFSWGVSNPTATGSSGMSAGKVAMQDINIMSVKSPRDAATGQASGKRAAMPAEPASASAMPASAAPKVGDVASFSVAVRESPTKASLSEACASGKPLDKVVMSNRDQRFELENVMVTSCALVGELRKYEFTGHVTLMK